MSQFRCQIVTPSESVLDESVSYVSFPAWDGQVGVMSGTSAFLMEVGAGSLRIEFGSGSRLYLLDGGFAQMQDDVLTLLSDAVTPADHLTLSEAQEDLQSANTAAVEPGHTDLNERKAIEHRQTRANAKVALAQATSSRPGSV
ncbi:MAG: F0F1 ATP synthase subunit epsilon [Phycisphaerales bacterium]|nr:F0F1 ATP synthase subunit epsilon [Phycisphaerales bacterium]